MDLDKLAARNVAAALREAMNAESAMMLSLGLKFPIDWSKLKKGDAQAERLMRKLIMVCEELSTIQNILNAPRTIGYLAGYEEQR
jgi:hypothetical protein